MLIALLVGCSAPETTEMSAAGTMAIPTPGDQSLVTTGTISTTKILATLAVTATVTPRLSPTNSSPSPSQKFASQTPSPTPQPIICSPLDDHTWKDLQEIITNPFNPPPAGKDSGHHGVDFAYYRRGERLSILGVQVEAVMAGRVAAAIQNRIPYGNMVIIETPFTMLPQDLITLLKIPAGMSIFLLYAHMNQAPLVELDHEIRCGQPIGEVGNTPKGWSSDPHLHLEGRIGPPGARFTGMAYYDTGATIEEMENYRLWRMSGEFSLFDPLILLSYGLSE